MTSRKRVIIAGAGPVGLMTALGLATQGIPVLVVEQEPALTEIARVLRPPGILGLLGNGFDTSTAWVARVRQILGPPAIERPGHWPSAEILRERFAEVDPAYYQVLEGD